MNLSTTARSKTKECSHLKTTIVRSRVSEDLKIKSEEVLDSLGISMSDAIRLFLKQMINAGTLPFELKPNHRTLESLTAPTITSQATNGAQLLRGIIDEQNSSTEDFTS